METRCRLLVILADSHEFQIKYLLTYIPILSFPQAKIITVKSLVFGLGEIVGSSYRFNNFFLVKVLLFLYFLERMAMLFFIVALIAQIEILAF